MTLKLGIIGCGGMGLRHMHGISELMKYSEIMKLEAVCDLHESAANFVASKAEEISVIELHETKTLAIRLQKESHQNQENSKQLSFAIFLESGQFLPGILE